ncbi:hypothetical protein D6C90_04161 [Aureobasidium pullulans]|uniref:Uncharacterized protein n=1 Tax=Aureobasidium pullulans TaxID=5580 RepID=A0A4S9MR43_AURPU|nr:hypothetical protein D6C97_08785 [Aureobasidium pullulans]THZ46811.1 hypothetical protein D6C90_04161 [Aureobasidium pullulans]
MDGRDSDTPESQRLRRELASQLRLFSTGGVPQAVNHNIQPYQLTPSSSNGFAPNQSSHAQPPRSTPTPYNSAAGIYQPSHPQQGQVFQPSSTRVLHGTSTGPSGSAAPNAAYGSFSGSAPVISTQHGNHPLSSAGQLPPSARSHQSPYQHQTQVSQGPGLAVQGFRFQPQVRPHPAFAPNNQPRTTYPPNAVPITGPTAGAPLQAGASFNFNNLLQTIASPTIQRPQFAAARHAPMPAGYPAPNIQPAPVPVPVPIPVDPTLRRIKYLTDTFHAAATNDPALYLLYCRFRDAQTQHVAFPELVFFLRLHLQVGWIEFLEQQGRQDEIGDTSALIHERKDLILWLVNQYKTLKQRAGEYLTRKLAAFAPLDFEPKKVSPVAFLIDHLYVLENDLFYKPKKPAAPTKQQYRIRVATYLDYEGGEPKVVQDANIQKNSTWEQMQGTLSALTQNIQSAQLGYNYGWLAGGYYGNWLFWAGESEEPQGWNRLLMTEGDFREMKGLLAQGQKVYIEHSQQVEVKDNLELADALGLGLYRPFDFCKPLPPGYRSDIMGAYPNPHGVLSPQRRQCRWRSGPPDQTQERQTFGAGSPAPDLAA